MTFETTLRTVLPAAILALAALVLPGPVLARADGAPPAANERIVLPADVTPDHYRIDVTPDARALTYTATVQIDVSVHEATRAIVLNTADIVIDKAALSGEIAPPAISYDDKVQTATFTFAHLLQPGPYTLSLAYHGKIYQQASGLFALDYETAAGTRRALFTQFENSDARRFVPSWDEPGRKATFQLTATVPADQMPISNMPIASTEPLAGGLMRVHFAQTPKMSSYLLFFGVGDFERIHRDVDGVDVGVVVKRGDTASGAFALDAAAHILPYYNSYFGTPYPLPKLDLIAGPGSSQFFGAMENWGAIFYFDRDLLIDPRVSTQRDRQGVYTTVAHEMAHQWFGDLVTMAWWDDLWLNEGFASWMQVKVTDHFHPEWNVWLQALRSKQSAMQIDARDGTHPIITPIDDVLQAAGAFDTITYSKGAAVIRTLEAYLGEDAFRAGVRRYMHDHAYANTVTDDLWTEMDRGSDRPIIDIAHDFTLQAGVPMISEQSEACDAGATRLTVSQGHFAIDPDSTTARVWRVPVTAAVLGAAPTKTVVSGEQPTPIALAGCGPVVLNAGQTAYFRSRYSSPGLAAIAAHYGDLKADDQLGVFNDTVALAYTGLTPMSSFLDLTGSFRTLTADPIVTQTVAGSLDGLDSLYRGLPGRDAYRAYARGILTPAFTRVGWDKAAGESDNTALARAALLGALGDLADPGVLAEARKRFAAFVADPSSLDAATRRTVLQIVATHADGPTWEALHTLAKAAKTSLEREEFYDLLGASEDDALAARALDLALSGEPPATVAPGIIDSVSDRHPAMAFDFAVAHWDQISRLLEPTTQTEFVPRLLSGATDPALIARLDAFAAAHIPASARRSVITSEATMRYLTQVRTQRLPQIDAWLKAKGGGS